MHDLTQLPAWQALTKHHQTIAGLHMRDLFRQDDNRFNKFSLKAANLLLDYSKNRVTEETLRLFDELFNALHLKEKIRALVNGGLVNTTENRPALHTALRERPDRIILVNNENIMPLIQNNLAKMRAFVASIHEHTWLGGGQKITDIVNLGVGGSDLGPALVTKALAPYHTHHCNFHFVSNIDSAHIAPVLKRLNPHSTLFIVSSKSFSTQETLKNMQTAKNWFQQQGGEHFAKHFIAITGNAAKAQSFGFSSENIFPVWEWVGGRYSLWSAIGLPITLAIGMDNFHDLLAGAHAMDEHFLNAPFLENMPVILALLSIWYINFFGARVQAVLPYEQYLKLLPVYLQQAEMESNGKKIRHNGKSINYHTSPVIFGTTGTNGQHAFYQLLHQGTQLIPADFIIAAASHHPLDDHHTILFANALSQSKALLEGKSADEALHELLAAGYDKAAASALAPHKTLPGNQPSNTIILPKLTPFNLGALIALYEHKIFVESVVWDINAFDQWSVELGKQLANTILPALKDPGKKPDYDASTDGLIRYYREINHTST